MRLSIEVEMDYALDRPADVLLQIEVAALSDQRIVSEALTIWSDLPIRAIAGEEGMGQRCLMHAVGRCTASYRAVVDVSRQVVRLEDYPATPVRMLPPALISYVMPSRYCQADRFVGFVEREFAGLEGGALAAALVRWVRGSLHYRMGMGAGGETTALDTFATRRGVCRDYAHLVVALARAGGIPARCVSAYAPGVDPPDFHAVAELWLAGDWRLVDATGMASCQDLARVVAGRDATDIAFMTIFGEATLIRQAVRVSQERGSP